jgi:galactose mutarotase-like enzyme
MTPFETITLADSGSQVLLAPSRGGMATRMTVGGRAVLYLDEATLLDPTKNVRGGNPVLFPSPGPLAGDRFTRDGRSGSMKQHGVARQRPWTVASSSAREATLVLSSDDGTRAEFPWDFALTLRYTLEGSRLGIVQRVENKSDAPMPFALGFHPYFVVADADKGKTSVPTRATRAWDNAAKKDIAVAGPIDLTAKEVDLHLVDHGASEATLALADGARVVLTGSEAYKRWVIWTLAGKDFVCLEPWTAPANALNTGDGLLVVAPGAATELSLSIAFVAPSA